MKETYIESPNQITLKTISGTYGSRRLPCNVLTKEHESGETWYVVEGSVNVNLSPHPLETGVDVEEIEDADGFTWNKVIDTLDELQEACAF
jgi:hypothetical protein|tara:strand:+ start:2949 stop:3221 length:273 start_codon:yes stop_codon:yes gene_type:complete